MRFAIALLLTAHLALVSPPMVQEAQAQADGMQRLSYGPDRLQGIMYWRGSDDDAPLVVFVHGGGWSRGDMRMMHGSDKLEHWQSQGYAVASVNYRLVPDATVEQQAQDVAAALAHLKRQSRRLGFDAGRLALTGHSAGAHLVALVGTDPQYLRSAGLSFADIRGVLPIDGAAYDVPRQIDEGGRLMRDRYLEAFGTEPARQRALSPTLHAARPNVPDFLIIHVKREDGREQSEALGAALRAAGTTATVRGFPGRGLRGHAQINRQLGDPDYPATPVVDAWLTRIFL